MSNSAVPTQASASALPEGITDPNYKPLPGRLGNLTVPQQHALEKLRKELQDEGHFVPGRMDDATLLRSVLSALKLHMCPTFSLLDFFVHENSMLLSQSRC